MIHFCWSARILQNLRHLPIHNRPAARRTPVPLRFLAHHRMTLAAYPFHTESLPHPSFPCPRPLAPRSLGPCLLGPSFPLFPFPAFVKCRPLPIPPHLSHSIREEKSAEQFGLFLRNRYTILRIKNHEQNIGRTAMQRTCVPVRPAKGYKLPATGYRLRATTCPARIFGKNAPDDGTKLQPKRCRFREKRL
jgi:hypothetical protein